MSLLALPTGIHSMICGHLDLIGRICFNTLAFTLDRVTMLQSHSEKTLMNRRFSMALV